jgi:hypothetical protein
MMLTEISKKIYEILSQDATLQGLLPHVKDTSNVWELRMPQPAKENQFPIVVFRITNATPQEDMVAIHALDWSIEIDIAGNEATLSVLYQIFDRIYELLQMANVSSGSAAAYRCRLDYMTTEYDKVNLTAFILTRWQIQSADIPSTKLSNL